MSTPIHVNACMHDSLHVEFAQHNNSSSIRNYTSDLPFKQSIITKHAAICLGDKYGFKDDQNWTNPNDECLTHKCLFLQIAREKHIGEDIMLLVFSEFTLGKLKILLDRG